MLNTTIREIFTVDNSVTAFADGQAVVHFKTQVGIFSPFFYVVGVQILACSAVLASETVAGKDSLSPFSYFALMLLSLGLAYTAFPSRVIRSSETSNVESNTARLTTNDSLLAWVRKKLGVTNHTTLCGAGRSIRPTFSRAVTRVIRTKWLNRITLKTNRAFFFDHTGIISRNTQISENYCAVILERMTTAFPDIEIKRIDG